MTAARRLTTVLLAACVLALLPTGSASAHPLGNFSVNHHDALVLRPDGVSLTAVVDRAEVPTAQLLRQLTDGEVPTGEELERAAVRECAALAQAVTVSVDGEQLSWTAEGATLELVPGAAGLPTLRATCELRADARLDRAATVVFRDDHLPAQVGWREITADGDGVRLLDPPVPVDSVSDSLRSYPEDLLASPLDVRGFEVATEPGENAGGAAPAAGSGDPFGSAMAALDRRLQSLVGDRGLTPLVGAGALLLALLLGAGHALLPGHGKTMMAAYLAGRRGRPRDALTVGATVTVTHTAGVLLLGLAVSLSSTLAGDQVLRWLGVVSGALVTVIGAVMLRGALRTRRTDTLAAHLPEPALAAGVPALTGAGAGVGAPAQHDHHGHGHDHSHGDDHDHPHGHDHSHRHGHDHGHSHGHGHGHGHSHHHGPGRGGLLGMGIAGGLVPSPSALVVLLASVALGRTVFGVVLVFAYGLGMAGTLTAVGLTLVRVRDRLARRLADPALGRWALRVTRTVPVLTAALVLLVGLALVVRGTVGAA